MNFLNIRCNFAFIMSCFILLLIANLFLIHIHTQIECFYLNAFITILKKCLHRYYILWNAELVNTRMRDEIYH